LTPGKTSGYNSKTMATDRYRSIVDLHIILMKEDAVLLGKRQNTGFQDGSFHLPAGHLEKDETLISGAIREAAEELGVIIAAKNLHFVLLLHQFSGEGRIAVFFEATEWQGEPCNLEPDKCSALEWYSVADLPDNMVPYARAALEQYRSGHFFATFGWDSHS